MKLTKKQTFIIKMTLSIMFAIHFGESVESDAIAAVGPGTPPVLFPFFVYPFFYILFFVLTVQWILLSDVLPKRWIITGILGCVISVLAMAEISYLYPFDPSNPQYIVAKAIEFFVLGIIATVPQGILLRKQGYLWVFLNGLGWMLNQIYTTFYVYPTILSVVPLYVILLVATTGGLPLGIILSSYLYRFVDAAYAQATN